MNPSVEVVTLAKNALIIAGQLSVAAEITSWLESYEADAVPPKIEKVDDLLKIEYAVHEDRIKRLHSARDQAEWLFMQSYCEGQPISASTIWRLPSEERRSIVNVALNACLAQSA